MQGEWYEVKVVVDPNFIEIVAGIFYGMNVKGVAIEDPKDITEREQGPLTWDFADLNILEYKGKWAVVKAYFPSDENIEEILNYINNKITELKENRVELGEVKVLSALLKEEDWANNWKKYYKPVKIGKNIVVKPLWEEYTPKEDEIILEMDPGMAFGTGTHETTRMCITLLEKYIKKDYSVFDIGTGSGILSIASKKLGAGKVVGVDLDPVAVASAKENVSFNNISDIEILQGNLMEVVTGSADIVVANIIAEIIIFLAKDVRNFIKKGGFFITSGIIKDKEKDVTHALESNGYEIVEIKRDGEWVAIVSQIPQRG